MQSITIQLPVINTGHAEEQARRKVLEALDDLINELCIQPTEISKITEYMLAVNQGVLDFLLVRVMENLVGEDAKQYVEEFVCQHNEIHLEKMRLQALERGWRT